MQILQEQRGVSLELTGALDINTVDEMRGVLLEHLEQHTDIIVDLSRVECCDAAGAQLLIALEKSAESSGKSFSILAISETFVRDCADLGIKIASSTSQADVQGKLTGHGTNKPWNLAKKKSAKKVVEASHA